MDNSRDLGQKTWDYVVETCRGQWSLWLILQPNSDNVAIVHTHYAMQEMVVVITHIIKQTSDQGCAHSGQH